MNEEFLHHVWKFKRFDLGDLRTTDNEPVEILKAGEQNFDSGPDFFNSKVKIGSTLWAGNVEIHINGSDWKKHHHQFDKAYDNVILHVVYHNDEDIHRASGQKIPTVELKSRIPKQVLDNYLNFKESKGWVACEKQIASVPQIILNATYDKLVLERLERKTNQVLISLKCSNNNWEESFYQLLARSFGFNTNAEPFELLAKALPMVVVAKHKSSRLQIEALLFGQAGMLDAHYSDKYPRDLQNEYAFLKQKFKLYPIDRHLWKYLRLRPVNFPTVRLAQFASLLFGASNLFSKVLEQDDLLELMSMFDVQVSEYWETHYNFDHVVKKQTKGLGEEAIQTIIINTVVPFLFVYGKQKGEEKYVERALSFLEKLGAERNSITSGWKQLSIKAKSAYESQALLQLKNEYCHKKQCLNCNIGSYILKNA